MAKHNLTITEAVDNKLVDGVQDRLAEWLANQPTFVRRKDSLAVVLASVAQVLSAVGLIESRLEPWAFWVIVGIAFVAQIGTIALTKAPITPTLVKRVNELVEEAAAPAPTPPQTSTFSVYH